MQSVLNFSGAPRCTSSYRNLSRAAGVATLPTTTVAFAATVNLAGARPDTNPSLGLRHALSFRIGSG